MLNLDKLVKSLKRDILILPARGTEQVGFGQSAIERMIPHRPPFLLLDNLTQLNRPAALLAGNRRISSDDDILAGHFPGNPVYPGVLQVEMMGQLGLCLLYFLQHGVGQIEPELSPVSGLFTKIHHVSFLGPVYPGSVLTIIVQLLEKDDFLGRIAGQVVENDKICSFSILEVYFDE